MPLTYHAPLDDIRFCLDTLLGAPADWKRLGLGDLDIDTAMAALEAAGSFCSETMLPLNPVGDQQGCIRLPDGSVKTPDGYRKAFELYREQGWSALACDPSHGGQGLPGTLQASFNEMQAATCQAFGMYPGLSLGAYECIHANASQELQDFYLPKLASGQWCGTMCLTEPQCGTDLGLLRSKATPNPDGTYSITGTKIFISAGEHDLSENIVHLVLARLPDAPAGTKGISLFAVPKFLSNPDGSLGARNAIGCARLEEKMGIHGNSTCEMLLESAVGRIVGQPHQGLKAMFVMMNGARLGVAMQGVGISEASRQAASSYARERLQSRALGGPARPELPADPLTVHPDVRRMLLTIRARAESGRMLSYWAAHLSDIAKHSPDSEEKADALAQLGVLTPVCKARLTDGGFESASLAMQIYGGHGYIRDNGVEQLARDARINMIYEGANGIQALDLVARKVLADQGSALRKLCAPINLLIEAHGADEKASRWISPLAKGADAFLKASMQTGLKAFGNLDEAGAASNDFLNALACLLEGYMFAKAAIVLAGDQSQFAQAKRATANFYFDKLFPEIFLRLKTMGAGNETLRAFDERWF